MIEEIKSVFSGFEMNTILKERQVLLRDLANYISNRVEAGRKVNLNFICTHNSRRSHMSQIWAQAAACYYDITGVYCYSGGTEATAMYGMVERTITSQGFQISKLSDQQNPVYAIKFDEVAHPIIAFSKKYDDSFNPSREYAAIMTCASADLGCPVVIGSDVRLPIRYDDPKVSDGTPEQAVTYLERSIQIGTEMKFVFYTVKESLAKHKIYDQSI